MEALTLSIGIDPAPSNLHFLFYNLSGISSDDSRVETIHLS